MKEPEPQISYQLNSSQVLFRFVLRLALLSTIATFSTHGFGASFAALSVLSALFCAVVAAMRREAIFGPILTHWDEAVAYLVISRLAALI